MRLILCLFLVAGTARAAAQQRPDERSAPVAQSSDTGQAVADEHPTDPDENVITARAVDDTNKLVLGYRARYIARQLSLSPEQWREFRELVEVILKRRPAPKVMEQIQGLAQQYLEAVNTKNEALQAETKELIDALNARLDTGPEFYENFLGMLSDEQKQKYERVIERLRRRPSGALLPKDLFGLVELVDPSPEQRAQIDALELEFRKRMSAKPTEEFVRRAQFLTVLKRQLCKILTPEQCRAFDDRLNRMRTDKVRNIEQMDDDAANIRRSTAGFTPSGQQPAPRSLLNPGE